MSSGKKILIALPGTLLVFLFLLVLFWDANWFKSSVTPHIKNLESHQIQFDTLEHSLFKPGKLTVRDVTISGPIVTGKIASLVVSVDVMKAINKDILVHEVILQQPDLNIDMTALNAYIARPVAPGEQASTEEGAPLAINSLVVIQAAINQANINDISPQKQFSITNLNLSLAKLNIIDKNQIIILEDTAPVRANLHIDNLVAQSTSLGTVSSHIVITKQTAALETLTLNTAKSQLNIKASASNLGGEAELQVTVQPSKLHLAEFQPLFNDIPVMPSGDMTMAANLTTQGTLNDNNNLLRALNGELSIGLQQGKLQGVDVNKVVAAFKNSKETDLKDIGSFILTGPVGILAANLFDLGDGVQAMEGETLIPQLQFNGTIGQGKLHVNNTAIATDQYRLAFDGAIDPLKSTFEEFTFAVLNEQGCADLTQTLNGDMAQPTSAVAKSLLDSAIAPITGLLNSVKNTVSDCEPFYVGDVAHPNQSE